MMIQENAILNISVVLGETALDLVSDDTTNLVLKILMYGATPLISLFGITGNILSIIIMRKHGLKKCSNILLVSLAFADLFYLIGFNNIPKILYNAQGNGRFIYPKNISQFLYVLYFIFFILDYGFGQITLTIPMLIAIERLVAVYIPLQFHLVITPFRIWMALLIVALYSLTYMIYSCFWYEFKYSYDFELNTTVGIMARSPLFYKDQHAMGILEEIYFSNKVQPALTLIGCILIILRVKGSAQKRLKMTSSTNNAKQKTSTSRTTQTLLSVCLVYIFVCIVIALPTYIPENYMAYSLTSDKPTNMGLIMYQVINIVMCTNSSWNFIIYIALNKNFRDTFKEITAKYNCCRFNKLTNSNI